MWLLPDSGEESDYENSPSSSKLDQLIQEVSKYPPPTTRFYTIILISFVSFSLGTK